MSTGSGLEASLSLRFRVGVLGFRLWGLRFTVYSGVISGITGTQLYYIVTLSTCINGSRPGHETS